MPPPFFPNSYTAIDAAAKRTSLASSVIKLFKFGLTPTNETVVADLDAAECDFDDYAPETITAWLPVVAAPGGGSQITAPTEQFLCAADQVTPNTVGGYWIELAGGDVVLIRQFEAGVPMVNAGDFLQVSPTIVVPNGT